MAAFGHIKKGAMHRDLGKAPGAPITQSDIRREAKKGPLGAKRANFARMAKRHFKPLADEFNG
jgi:hypothetical protein